MAPITYDRIKKVYPDGTEAIPGLVARGQGR